MSTATLRATDGTGLLKDDPYLEPHANHLRARHQNLIANLARIDAQGGILGPISQGHQFFGFNRGEFHGTPGVWYREWAPGALQLRLFGDFNNWNRWDCPLVPDSFGIHSIFLPDSKFADKLTHGSKLKTLVVNHNSTTQDRIPAYIRRVVQDANTPNFTGQFWMPPEEHAWQNPSPRLASRTGLRIYESHVGMATEEGRVGSFNDFADHILPRVKKLGYNAIQLMAVQEHPYYGSFGYHVSNFYAVSSRFGTPEELKRLIDIAHGMGILVIMDLVHSHSVKNTHEGLNLFDGTDFQYFHAGPKGHHVAWDSKLFDYAKYEVQRFLLSNVRYWLEEFKFDGFRFDGVTSMLYLDHGLGKDFVSYSDYFGDNTDRDALLYLQLANLVAHAVKPDAITVAEDVSGMPGLARPVAEGGLGFDYRLAMGVPDYWIKLLKEKTDEQWSMGEILSTLLNRRHAEKHIGYVESHDQALVGDKTIAFWLMDKAMYFHMDTASQSFVVDRGISLHKLIRLLTFTLSGEGYLNFMGNEFGHPEWIDFPREGNNYSYHYARRQWSLADNPILRYGGLQNFEIAMQKIDDQHHILCDKLIEQLMVHEEKKLLVYRRGAVVFAFNFHPTNSYTDLRIPVPDAANYKIILNSDAREFGGHGLVLPNTAYSRQDQPMENRQQSIQIYLPSRTAQVLQPV